MDEIPVDVPENILDAPLGYLTSVIPDLELTIQSVVEAYMASKAMTNMLFAVGYLMDEPSLRASIEAQVQFYNNAALVLTRRVQQLRAKRLVDASETDKIALPLLYQALPYWLDIDKLPEA